MYQRAGWTSFGPVADRYIQQSSPGDAQALGHTVCGLNLHEVKDFAVLPPHLFTNNIDIVQRSLEALEKKVDELCDKMAIEFTEIRKTVKESNESSPNEVVRRLQEMSIFADTLLDQLSLRTAISNSQNVLISE